jgi:hypothetical protein
MIIPAVVGIMDVSYVSSSYQNAIQDLWEDKGYNENDTYDDFTYDEYSYYFRLTTPKGREHLQTFFDSLTDEEWVTLINTKEK